MILKPIDRLGVVLALVATLAASASASAADKAGPPGILVIPTTNIGTVRELFLLRVAKAVSDTLSFSNAVRLLKENDRAGKEEDTKGATPKDSAKSRQIADADRTRQEGTDLAMAGKHKVAYRKLRHAAKAYELAFSELVDFTKLADAYARSAVSGWYAKHGARDVVELFRLGLALQPTLVIDRRGTDKKLLELFDGMREGIEKSSRHAIDITGGTPEVIAFVDGVKIGPLPARASGLLPGTHYVQVRGPGWHSWAKSVALHTRDASVKAKLKAIKAAKAKEVKIWTIADVTPCAAGGKFVGKDCRNLAMALAAQTGAEYLLFTALAADRYGRLTVHPFLMRVGKKGAVVGLKSIEVAKNLADLNSRMTDMEQAVVAAIKDFPTNRALNRTPKVFK